MFPSSRIITAGGNTCPDGECVQLRALRMSLFRERAFVFLGVCVVVCACVRLRLSMRVFVCVCVCVCVCVYQ